MSTFEQGTLRQSLEPLVLMTSVWPGSRQAASHTKTGSEYQDVAATRHIASASHSKSSLPASCFTQPRRHLQPLGSAAKRLFPHSHSLWLFFPSPNSFPQRLGMSRLLCTECDDGASASKHKGCLCQQAHRVPLPASTQGRVSNSTDEAALLSTTATTAPLRISEHNSDVYKYKYK